jgi:metal-responsive CopG/Arc/MetJ family transcriptional regulator
MKKEKHLRIRINNDQFRQLVDTIIKTESISKSEFIRQAIIEKIKKSNKHKKKMKPLTK